jgi:hypothetical protein
MTPPLLFTVRSAPDAERACPRQVEDVVYGVVLALPPGIWMVRNRRSVISGV